MAPPIVDELARLAPFHGVPAGDLEELARLAPPVEFPDRASVFEQDARADVALLVVRGRLVVSVREEGLETELGFVEAGETVGEQALLSPGAPRLATVRARGAASCMLLSPDLLGSVTGNAAWVAIERHLLDTLVKRIRETERGVHAAWAAVERTTDVVRPSSSHRERAAARPSLRERLRAAVRGAR